MSMTEYDRSECVVVLFSWTRTDFYALQVFGKFIKCACSEINWRWLIESCVWCRQLEVITLAKGAGRACRGKHSLSKRWGAVLLASWEPSTADWYWRRDSSDGCWRISNTSSWPEGSNSGFRKITLNSWRWKRSSRLRTWAESKGHASIFHHGSDAERVVEH